jgi:hypothetical protein
MRLRDLPADLGFLDCCGLNSCIGGTHFEIGSAFQAERITNLV